MTRRPTTRCGGGPSTGTSRREIEDGAALFQSVGPDGQPADGAAVDEAGWSWP